MTDSVEIERDEVRMILICALRLFILVSAMHSTLHSLTEECEFVLYMLLKWRYSSSKCVVSISPDGLFSVCAVPYVTNNFMNN